MDDSQPLSDLHARQVRDLEGKITDLENKLARERQKRSLAESEAEELRVVQEFRSGIREGEGAARLPPFRPKDPSGPATAVICLNDWHGEETVEPDTVNGKNEYNLEIAERRIRNVGDRALRLLDARRKLSHIRDAVVWIGGDIITGHIHEELVEGNSLSPLRACKWAKGHIVGILDYLLEFGDFDSIAVTFSRGNHGRTTVKPRVATAAEHSYEYWMYDAIAEKYADRGESRVQFKLDRSYHSILDIQGKRVRFHHGDYIKYAGGVGGITIPVNKAIAEWNKSEVADYDVFGHWHQFLRHRRWCACNCMIGYNAYAVKIKAEYSEPSQTMIVFDRDRPTPVSVDEIYCD